MSDEPSPLGVSSQIPCYAGALTNLNPTSLRKVADGVACSLVDVSRLS